MTARSNAFSKADQAQIGKKRLLPFHSRVRGREAREMGDVNFAVVDSLNIEAGIEA